MSSYDISFAIVEHDEGGYSNDSRDGGKETYEGISRVYNPHWAGWPIIDAYKKSLGGKIKWNTRFKDAHLESLVKDYYKSEYWIPSKAGLFKSQELANLYFDTYINSGRKYGVEFLKEALNKSGKAIKVDDHIDSLTLNLVNTVDTASLYNAYKARRTEFIKSANKINPAMKPGIIKRIQNSFPDLVKKKEQPEPA